MLTFLPQLGMDGVGGRPGLLGYIVFRRRRNAVVLAFILGKDYERLNLNPATKQQL